MSVASLMMKLISANVSQNGNTVLPKNIDDETLKRLFILSKKHDVVQIVCDALVKNGIIESGAIYEEFNKQKMLSIFRREQLDFEESRLYKLFEEEGIDYIPLKGAVLKDLYPQKWMRTSCDIDILVRKDDLEKASELIRERLSAVDEGQHLHDRSFITKNKVHIELHFSLEEPYEKANPVLERVWEYASVQQGRRFSLENEFLIFHVVSHMQAHFVGGGCGIRPFIDLFLVCNKLDFSKEKLSRLIEECNMTKFFNSVLELSRVWFEGRTHSKLSKSLEEYITEGGAFGSRANYSAATRHQKGGKIGYLATRIFPPKEQIKSSFPKLRKRPYLLPFYYFKRWFGLFNISWAKNISHEFISKEKEERVSKMMKELEL